LSASYIELLDDVMESGLRFPAEFVGRSDIGRGGLLLRQADQGCELAYVTIALAVRGRSPSRLARRHRRKLDEMSAEDAIEKQKERRVAAANKTEEQRSGRQALAPAAQA